MIETPGRFHSKATDHVVAGANEILDDDLQKKQSEINAETFAELGELKDKAYAPDDYSGLGRKILRKNMVNGINTLTQSMINQPNTIYVVQYDFTLGEDITIPDNCVLEFDGGSISNGTITFNNTFIKSEKNLIFIKCEFLGDAFSERIYQSWFDNLTSNVLTSFNSEVIVLSYDISNDITISKPIKIISDVDTIKLYGELFIDSNNVTIYGVNFENYVKFAIECNRLTEKTDDAISNLNIDGCVFTNYYAGDVSDSSFGIRLLGNICKSAIQNCQFYNYDNGGYAIHFSWRRDSALQDFNNYLPTQNIIRNCRATDCSNGFSFSGGYGNIIDNCIVENAENEAYFMFDGHLGNIDNFHVISSITNCIAKNVKTAVSFQGSDFSSSPTVHNVKYLVDNLYASSNVTNNSYGILMIAPFDGELVVRNSLFKDFYRCVVFTTYSDMRDQDKNKGNFSFYKNKTFGTSVNTILIGGNLNCLNSIDINNNIFDDNISRYFIEIGRPSKFLMIDNNVFSNNYNAETRGFIGLLGTIGSNEFKKYNTYLSISNNSFNGVSIPISSNTGLPRYIESLEGNSSPFSEFQSENAANRNVISVGKNKLEFSYSGGDISLGRKETGDIVFQTNNPYLLGYKNIMTSGSFNTFTSWQANAVVSDGEMIYYTINNTDYVFVVIGDGNLGTEPPTGTTRKNTETNGDVILMNLGIKFDSGKISEIHTDLSCSLADLPNSGVPNGFKAYVNNRKHLAVKWGNTWYNPATSLPVSEGRGGINLPSASDNDFGVMYLYAGIYPNRPIWRKIGGFIEADGAVVGVARYGTTSNRPIGSSIFVGFQYFDTTIGKPIYASVITGDTVTWVDATGQTV